jgi:hypothetical protein
VDLESIHFAVENTVSDRVDFAQLINLYRNSAAGEARYNPEVVSTERLQVIGNPDPLSAFADPLERQN